MVAKTLPAAGDLSLNFLPVLPSMSCLPRRSTSKLNSARKSAPRMGKATPACRKFQVNCWPPILTDRRMDPQQGMGLPLALVRAGPVAGAVDWCGITEYTAPVSTRKDRFDSFSTRIKRRPGGPGPAVTAPAVRPTSFPCSCRRPGHHTCRQLLRTSYACSTP